MVTVYTAGHGSRDLEDFVRLLVEAGVDLLVDARARPRSRRHPHFGYGPLGARLAAEGIGYDWRRVLGGMRRPQGRVRHPGLDDPALQGYAEYMESAAFAAAMERIATQGAEQALCIMCAERDPAQCHRSLIADWLVAHGHRVVHLVAAGEAREHVLHRSARIDGGRLYYPDGSRQRELF